MIPGEYLLGDGDIEANAGRLTRQLTVANTGDRPIQVGSHFHFFEANRALRFDRGQAFGMRLNVPAGTAVRFEPGDEKTVTLVELAGAREVYGLNALTEVMELGAPYWEDVRAFGKSAKLLSPDDDMILAVATAMPRKLPTDKQATRLIAVRDRCIDAGFEAAAVAAE